MWTSKKAVETDTVIIATGACHDFQPHAQHDLSFCLCLCIQPHHIVHMACQYMPPNANL